MNALKSLFGKLGPLGVDIVERALTFYVVAFAGLVLAGDTGQLSVGTLKAAALAAVPAALEALRGYVASKFGNPETASFLK